MKKYIKILSTILLGATIVCCQGTNRTEIINLTASQPILPVLAKREQNKILDINIQLKDSMINVKTAVFTFSLEGTSDLADIETVSLLYSKTGSFEEAKVVGTQKQLSNNFKILTEQVLVYEENQFWLSAKLKAGPNLNHSISVQLESIQLEDGNFIKANNETKRPQRIGIALRKQNDDNVNTFRIPGLVTTNKGTLIGVYDVRYNDPVDLQENIDVGLSRSTDGGKTWESMKIIMDMEEYGGKSEDENGIGDPAVLVDSNTNTIWVAGLWFHGKKGKRAWNASEPGMSPEKTGQFMLVKSHDDGVTWSDPINITEQIKNPEWQLFFNGPGMGITMKDGTLVFAAQFKDANEIPHSTIIYSKDGGKTWKVGTSAKSETTEAQVVELSDGSLMLNMRDDRNRVERKDSLNGRSVAITKDLGKTWVAHATSRKSLQSSNCMASLISYDHPDKGKILFFSNPDTKINRDHITIKTSFDEGVTWPKENQLEVYEENTFGYSCLTIINDEYLGILYEGSRELFFEKIPIADFIDK